MSSDIGGELDRQNEQLESMNAKTDAIQHKMHRVTKQVKDLT
jgi:hypothetical protein